MSRIGYGLIIEEEHGQFQIFLAGYFYIVLLLRIILFFNQKRLGIL